MEQLGLHAFKQSMHLRCRADSTVVQLTATFVVPVLMPSLGVMEGVAAAGVMSIPGVRSKLAPGVPNPAGVAPIGVLIPARRWAIFSCACCS